MLRNCRFYGNFGYYGAALYFYRGTDLLVDRCTITGNVSSYCGGLQAVQAPDLMLTNTVIAGNEATGLQFSYTYYADIEYCTLFDNGSSNFSGTLPDDFGQLVTVNANGDSCDAYYNILLNPAFVDTVRDDYRMTWRSPCIDAGNPDAAYNDPDGTTADMGAYFYDQSNPARILLTPYNNNIYFSQPGGIFRYDIHLTNIDPAQPPIEVWINVTLPDGSIVGPLIGPVTTALDSGLTVTRERSQSVPGAAPGGVYTYHAYAVVDADTSMDALCFTKASSIDGVDGGWFSVADQELLFDGTLPATSALVTCYPNPFNPATVVRYTMQAASQVTLAVYDVSGRKVADLVNGWRDAGLHEATFDGNGLPSGLYIYRLAAGDFTASGKMVLTK